MTYAIVGGCVFPSRLAPFMTTLQNESHAAYQSGYRGEDPPAVRLLHILGKHDQAEIYSEYIHGLEPNPANPPGQSTHECRSDGVPYPGPKGRPLDWWQCGIDVDDAHVEAIIAAAAKHGWHLFRPYSGGSEYHHVNFRSQPANPVVDLRVGDSGAQVRILSARLRLLKLLRSKSNTFGPKVHGAVIKFQKSQHMTADGVVGPKTWNAIKNAVEHPKPKKK